MTNSEIFKAAHALAKAYQAKFKGDYVVYLSYAMKLVAGYNKECSNDETLFKAINNALVKQYNSNPVFFYEKKSRCTHGLLEFRKSYQLDKAAKGLEAGQSLGKRFTKNGMICAWVQSFEVKKVAY